MAKPRLRRYCPAMSKRAAAVDDRQQSLPIDLPPAPPMFSDRRAREEILIMLDTLEAAKTHPWSARLLGWQVRRMDTFAQLLTPLDAAAFRARFESELERLGPPLEEDDLAAGGRKKSRHGVNP
jgi:hypothetical protein